MIKQHDEDYNFYETKDMQIYEKLNIKKVILLILMILVFIGLIFIVKNSLRMIDNTKVYEQYKLQLDVLENDEKYKQSEIEKQKKEEEEKIRKEKLPQLTDEGRQNISSIYSSETKRAFLTFDDGPSSVTPTILDILKQENIKATFFVLGSRVDAMPDMVKRIYDEGHYIANHGYSHQYQSIYQSPQTVLDEYNNCNNSVRNAIGVQE